MIILGFEACIDRLRAFFFVFLTSFGIDPESPSTCEAVTSECKEGLADGTAVPIVDAGWDCPKWNCMFGVKGGQMLLAFGWKYDCTKWNAAKGSAATAAWIVAGIVAMANPLKLEK